MITIKIAIIGSRSLIDVDISKYIPENVTEIISGGAIGIDTLAEKVADERRISKSIIRPEYDKYGKKAPLIRNKENCGKSGFCHCVLGRKIERNKIYNRLCKKAK